jgi:hypothetical protein
VRGAPFEVYELTGENVPLAQATWLAPVIPANVASL